MIFTAAPVRFAPHSGSLCRLPYSYSSFSTPNIHFTSAIIPRFRVLSTGFSTKRAGFLRPGRPVLSSGLKPAGNRGMLSHIL